jgi:nucleolar protein 14
VEGLEDTDVCTVVQRIRTLYHASLAPDNKFKLQVCRYYFFLVSSSQHTSQKKLATVLIDHILYVASPRMARCSLISSLFPHILALTRTYPIPIAQHFNEKLTLMHKNLKRGLSQGVLKPESKTWPGIPELSLLRIIGLIWSTSDLHHTVVSPTRLIIGAYLGLCRVRSLRDIASGLFLSTLILQFEALSKRFVPEATNFLTNAVLHLAPHRYEEVGALPGSFPSPDFKSELCRRLTLDGKARKNACYEKA